MASVIDIAAARRVLEVVDKGLITGKGRPCPGHMCVEAAVCYALGEPHSDRPSCVGQAVRMFKIQLNDSAWCGAQSRAAGLRDLAVAQLGSLDVDQIEFAQFVTLESVRQILPIALRLLEMEQQAVACETVADVPAASKTLLTILAEVDDDRSEGRTVSRAVARMIEATTFALQAGECRSTGELPQAEAKAELAASYVALAAEVVAQANARVNFLPVSNAGDDARLAVMRHAAKIGMDALRHVECPGVALLDSIKAELARGESEPSG